MLHQCEEFKYKQDDKLHSIPRNKKINYPW